MPVHRAGVRRWPGRWCLFSRTRFHLFVGLSFRSRWSLFSFSSFIVWWPLSCFVPRSRFNTLMRNHQSWREPEKQKKTFGVGFVFFGSISFPSRSIIWMKFYVFFVDVWRNSTTWAKGQQSFAFLNIFPFEILILFSWKLGRREVGSNSEQEGRKIFSGRATSMNWSTLGFECHGRRPRTDVSAFLNIFKFISCFL